MLQKNYKIDRRVSFYADLLILLPGDCEMSEEILGMSAKQVIIDKVLKEGLLMLKHTPLTITEVMYELGFKDEGILVPFSKHIPAAIRKNSGLWNQKSIKKRKKIFHVFFRFLNYNKSQLLYYIS
ncbi:hypothetical protein QW060_23230 [Myroides ceti]|uniref:Uncharacterized protein n=1 Tax=Paenimyroides ceti TaxID=395087 RepID=A0ABT8CZ50_9FLAO|nr:hypothetical protein [Paenimyroides ceti]MDN3709850.1 hypothetical protein [Paenimyroides ceti]